MTSPVIEPYTELLPRPDPTKLTTEAVDRAIGSYRDLVETRLEGIDKATTLHASAVTRLAEQVELERVKAAADVSRQLDALGSLFQEKLDRVSDVASEKFFAVERRIEDRDQQRLADKAEAAVGLAAALAAQKEAVAAQNTAVATASNKQEVAFQRLLDQQTATTSAQIAGLVAQQADLKERLARAEAAAQSAHDVAAAAAATRVEVKTEGRMTTQMAVLIVGFVITVVLFFFKITGTA